MMWHSSGWTISPCSLARLLILVLAVEAKIAIFYAGFIVIRDDGK